MSINKLSKYGIVLVAAVTVATVAQSQFGQSSSKVYADEIASTVPTTSEAPSTTPATSENVSTTPAVSTSPETSEASAVSTTPATSEAPTVSTAPATSEANLNNYRMFYIKDSFYPNLKDYMGFAGRVTTADKPYTVEKGSTLPEYPYYTIVGSDGKTYSVGDTITINNPLVNHPDENDNVLHYYYYPFNPNSVSEAPAVSTTPATSEAPAVSTTPATSENPISDNDPRLNRMLYINVSSPDDPTLGWLTGEVVTPKGYIVKSAGEVEGFPYFTITGSNGKNYSVGDIITTEEPGLFGHANYEDDALYYRYYRTNPNSVSEAPANSTTPATSETPAVSTAPATSETPAVSTTPATSEAPAVSTTPATSEAPAVSTTPATSEAPAVSTAPATSEAPAVSTAPATSEAPAVSVTPATSEAPAVSTTPATSEAPAVSTAPAPATSEAPAVSTAPATSEAPAVSTTPATSEAPAVSTTPATSEAPAVSTTPATSEATAVSTAPATSEAPAASTTPAVTPSTSVNPASSVTLDKLSQKAYKKMSSAQRWASVSSPLASKADHSMDSAMISSTQSHDEGMTPATGGKLAGHNLPNTGDTNAKVGILGMIFVGLGLTSLAYKGRHRRSK